MTNLRARISHQGAPSTVCTLKTPYKALQDVKHEYFTLDDVANAVRRSSLVLSAGNIDTRDARGRIRTIGRKYDQLDFEEIVVIARKDGTVVRLGDIADVRDAFRNTDLILRHQGRPALFVEVYRAEGEQVMDVARCCPTSPLSAQPARS